MSGELQISDWSDINSTAHLDELPFRKRLTHIINGLHNPECPGHNKWAKFQLKRSYAAVSGMVVPLLLLALITFLATVFAQKELIVYDTVTLLPDEEPPLEDPVVKPEPEEDIKPPDETEIGEQLLNDLVAVAANDTSDYDDPADEDPTLDNVPLVNDTAVLVTSPIKFRMPVKSGLGRRLLRKRSLEKYGAPPGAESSVLLALRWLKKNQNSDGTWGKTKPAITSLALLTYLAHAETPESKEFGTTVEKALRWLLENQTDNGRFNGSDNHEYSLPIAAYALSEAFSMTRIPDVRYAAEKSVRIIVKGQHPGGGWDYNCKQSERNDTSYMGWCVQALKAAKLADLDVEGLDKALTNAIAGLKSNYAGNSEYGGFGYTSGSKEHGLTSVGVLCLQMLGRSGSSEVSAGLNTLAQDKFRFNLLNPGCGKNGLYYWYYTTQAMFHAGGEQWNRWNDQFSTDLVSTQKIIPGERSEYRDHKGQAHAIGYWNQYRGSGHEQGPEFATVLCALQLEVYYRYIPSFQTIPEPGTNDVQTPDDGLRIDIQLSQDDPDIKNNSSRIRLAAI